MLMRLKKYLEIMEIKFKKLIPEAQMPIKSYEADAGFDFYCTSIVRKYHPDGNYLEYHTGIALDIPKGMVGLAFPRSSIIKKHMMLKNSVGIIDSGYLGEIIFMFHKTDLISDDKPNNYYKIGDRIGQIVFLNIPEIILIETDQLSETERNINGFGSTNNYI